MWSRRQAIENMNFYSDPRTIQGMATKHKGFEADGSVCWNFVIERIEFLYEDGELETPVFEGLNDDEVHNLWNKEWRAITLDYLRRKFPQEFHEIPSFENLIEASKEGELNFPRVIASTKWAICSLCDGNGKHVNPSIDCGGITQDEFDEDPDFRDDYFSGRYDVQCKACEGTGKVRTIGGNKGFVQWVLEEVERADEASMECAREMAWEMRWGC